MIIIFYIILYYKGDLAERRRRESERDTNFEIEWTELNVISKSITHILDTVSTTTISNNDNNRKMKIDNSSNNISMKNEQLASVRVLFDNINDFILQTR